MKLFKKIFGDMGFLSLWIVMVLMVPNIALCFTESVSGWSRATNLLLPAGVYLMILSLWKRTGALGLMMLPFMALAGFQIVLLYLYGGSVIAVDMFLNVVTTNVSEATELLANLLAAMGVVIVLYIPVIVWSVAALVERKVMARHERMRQLKSGAAVSAAGLTAMVAAMLFTQNYSFIHETFPVNAISNMVEACRRYDETSRHEELSAGFSYNATSSHHPEQREIYLFVIGETARGENWQLGGYDRPTNPRMSEEEGVVFFSKSISESNTTHKSVPMLMSFASAENFDSIAYYKSMITAFKEAGFSTAFISNQEPNRSYTEFFGNEADEVAYVQHGENDSHAYDDAVFRPLDRLLSDSTRLKQLIVIHTYGSHFKYYDRYPAEFAYFTPDDAIDAKRSNRPQLINAYDNSIRYTDYILSGMIDRLKERDVRAAILYASDHGEDIFDDERERFLHASPVPTVHQIHQASLVWTSPRLADENPEMVIALKRNADKRISPQKSLFPTVMQLAGINSWTVVDSLSLVSPNYNAAPAVYLNDLNQSVPIKDCGLKPVDIDILSPLM